MVEPILFYTKPGCSLCDKVWPAASSLAERYGLELRKVDIEAAGGELYERHRYRIPVIEWRGVELAWGRIDAAALEEALAREQARRH